VTNYDFKNHIKEFNRIEQKRIRDSAVDSRKRKTLFETNKGKQNSVKEFNENF